MASTLLCALVLSLGWRAAPSPPRLVVLLVVDQMRADYVDKLRGRWNGGFHRLLTEGAWFRQANYPYFNTVTCAGHATIGTGALPSAHGMVLNGWYDRTVKQEVACVADPATTIVSYGAPLPGSSESAWRMRLPTLADEMRAQLSPASRAVGFSLKARTAVTLVGHRAEAAIWFDDRGGWVTSSAFAKAPLATVQDFVRAHPIDSDLGRRWDRLLDPGSYLFESPAIGTISRSHMTPEFPHELKAAGAEPDKQFFDQWQSSPFADAYLAEMALAAANGLHLGAGTSPDVIAIGFSTLDKVGHDYGPNSHETQDVLLRLDRTLDGLFAGLDRLVGAGNYLVALTADHGVPPIPERARAQGLDAGRVKEAAVIDALETALRGLGPGKHVAHLSDGDAYLAPGVWRQLQGRPSMRARVRALLQQVPGVATVYFRDQLEPGSPTGDPTGQAIARGYDRERSGDLVIALRPYWFLSSSAASHGSSYGYDTHVPILMMGPGIAPGEYVAPASPLDIAPTLGFIVGVTLPHSQGRVLTEALVR